MAGGYSRSAFDEDLRGILAPGELVVFRIFGEEQFEGISCWISILEEPPDHL